MVFFFSSHLPMDFDSSSKSENKMMDALGAKLPEHHSCIKFSDFI
jgi:hypothetical protein